MGNTQQKLRKTAVRRCSSKQVFLKILQYSQENTSVGISFLSSPDLKNIETPTKVFSCDNCEFFKNSLFYRTPLMAASKHFCVCVYFMQCFLLLSKFLNKDNRKKSVDFVLAFVVDVKQIFSHRVCFYVFRQLSSCWNKKYGLKPQGQGFEKLPINSFLEI